MYWGIKNVDASERCKAVPYLMVETQQAEMAKSLKEIEERQKVSRALLQILINSKHHVLIMMKSD